jgi:glutamate--cysteine ligase regulatory subunit
MSGDRQDENQMKFEPVLKPFFPKATEILFYTGNTLASFKLLKKNNSSITEELIEYMSIMLQSMRKEMDEKQFQDETYVKLLPVHDESPPITINGATPGVPIDSEQLTREDLKFSVKVFLRSLEPEILRHTINTVLNELQESYVESVMISLPNYGAQLTLNEFMPLWTIVEDFIDKQKILSAGVCDFMLPLLSDLYDAAKHKPYANQINLGVCCSIPEELNKYVKENNIQLLTHSDPIDVLNESDFQQTIREYCHEYDTLNWKPCSVVRYSSVIANRGIIKSKGFLIYAKRELRMP